MGGRRRLSLAGQNVEGLELSVNRFSEIMLKQKLERDADEP